MKKKAFPHYAIKIGDEFTENVMAILHEVKHALDKLVEKDQPTLIDLRGTPLASGEEDKILQTLGHGEVDVRLDLLGPSEAIETKYTGVWIVTHCNNDKEVISRTIEITRIPDILCSKAEELAAARDNLAASLEDIQRTRTKRPTA